MSDGNSGGCLECDTTGTGAGGARPRILHTPVQSQVLDTVQADVAAAHLTMSCPKFTLLFEVSDLSFDECCEGRLLGRALNRIDLV